jgi:hypothetical protein
VRALLVLPSPLAGEGRGEGGSSEKLSPWTPTPNLESELRSPRTPQGGGERTADAAPQYKSNGALPCP